MIQKYIKTFFGIVRICLLKLLYIKRLSYKSIPIGFNNFNFFVESKSKMIFGKNCRYRSNFTINVRGGGVVKIGDSCFFNDSCSLNCHKKIIIGDNLMCGQNVMFFDHDHDYKNDINSYVCNEIKIGNNVWIGANSIILKGVTIGDNVVIAAGTTVRDDIDNNTLVYQEKKTVVKKIL